MAVSRVQLITVLLVLIVAAPVAAIALWSIHRTAVDLADPCAHWNYPSGQPIAVDIGPLDPCRAKSVHAESKARAVVTAALVPGGLLFAALLAVTGAAISRRRAIIAAAIALLAETLVVFSIAPLTLLAGISLLLLATRVPAPS